MGRAGLSGGRWLRYLAVVAAVSMVATTHPGSSAAALQSISDVGIPTDFVFDLPDGSADATLRPYPADPSRLEIVGAAFEDTNFAVPTNSLTINGGSGLDSLTITGTIDLGAARLAVSTERIVVSAGASVSTTGDVTLTASAFDSGTLPGFGPPVPASVAGDPLGVESIGASGVAAVIVQNAVIGANRISLTADATTDVSNSSENFIHIDTEATATVAVSDSSLTSTGDIIIESAVTSNVNARAQGGAGELNGTDGAIASIDVAAASTSSVTGSTVINAGGALTVLSSTNIDAEGSGDAFAGNLGGGVAVTKVSQLTHAFIDTTTVAWSAESVSVRSRADDTVSSSSSSSPDGSDLADAGAGSPSPDVRTDGNANSIRNAGALSYTEHLATTEAYIQGGVAITTTGSQLVEAQSNHATSATADGSTAAAGGTGDANAIAVNVVDATTDAWVGGSAELTARGGVSVTAPLTGTFDATATPGLSAVTTVYDTLQSNQVSNTRSAAVRPGSSLAAGGITVLADTTTTLELVGDTINDSGGSATTGQWSFSATGSHGVPGSFVLSQVGPEGYALTSLSCNNAAGQVTSVVLAIGAEIVCTFVNDDLVPPAECGVGTFSATGVEPCDDAPAGSYVAEAGATGATPCATGSYQPLTAQSSCDPAPAGSFVDTEGATAATPCAVGTFSAETGAVACTPAPAGFFVADEGATAATPCPVGTFSAVTGAAACTPAPTGSFVATEGAVAATDCPVGTFSAETGAVACTPAPAGFFVADEGATAATPCAVGTFSPVEGAVACTPAPAGSYVDTPGAAAPTPCPENTTTEGTGSASVDACLPEEGDSTAEVVSEVSDIVAGLLADPSTPEKAVKDLEKAAKELADALDKLEDGDLEKALKEIEKAGKELTKAGKDGADVGAALDLLVGAAQAEAEAAIDAAIAADGDPDKIAKAQEKLAKAESALEEGKPDKALKEYAKAVKEALKAIE